jgi:hypothetical protein
MENRFSGEEALEAMGFEPMTHPLEKSHTIRTTLQGGGSTN